MLSALIFFGVLFLASLAGTRALIPLLTRRAVLDVPNERSSHALPKPHGGGIAVVIVLLVGWIGVLAIRGDLDSKSVLLAGMTAGLAVLSFIDDVKNLSRSAAASAVLSLPDGGDSADGFYQWLVPVWSSFRCGFAWLGCSVQPWTVSMESLLRRSALVLDDRTGYDGRYITSSGAGDGCRNYRLSGLERQPSKSS